MLAVGPYSVYVADEDAIGNVLRVRAALSPSGEKFDNDYIHQALLSVSFR